MVVAWREHSSNGGILIMTLVFVTMFLVIFVGLAGLTGRQFRQGVLQSHDELAFQMAEAGLNYARWRLAHDPDIFDPISQDVTDQLAGVIGGYDITFSAPDPGSTIVEITSVGKTASQPSREVTLKARYGIQSLAKYSFVTNSDVWVGPVETIKGPMHGNGGIRMDGSSDSLLTSAKETYTCQTIHGCNPPQTKDGVWGNGTTQELWEYPAPPIDYNAITTDLLDMKSYAQANNTYYDKTNAFGYHVVFNDDNTYSVYRVTSLGSKIRYWDPDTERCERESHDIGNEQFIETRNVPSNGVLYFEDTTWVEGDIRDRVTVAAGRFPDTPNTNVDIILNGDITYGGVRDGSRAFAAIAQRHTLIPWSAAEDVLDLDGAFVAQKGRHIRYLYSSYCNSPSQHRTKTQLNLYGMIATNGVRATTWVSGGTVVSGYQTKTTEYDPHLLYEPPPFFPTSGQYEFLSWEQEQ